MKRLITLSLLVSWIFGQLITASPVAAITTNNWYLRNLNSSGPAHGAFIYGDPGDVPIMGDWNGDNYDTPGVFRNGSWYLRNYNSGGTANLSLGFGNPTDIPVVGDWNGDGIDTIGVVRGNMWYLRNSNTSGPAEISFMYGDAGDKPVVGDWDGNNTDTPGIVRGNMWYLRNSNTSGGANLSFMYGDAGDKPVVGDWDGNNIDSPGIFRTGTWYLRNSNSSGGADGAFNYGNPSDRPLVGNWDGDPYDTIGVFRNETSTTPPSGGYSAAAQAQMNRLYTHARNASLGRAPDGRCYFHVANYIDAVGYGLIAPGGFDAAIPSAYWAEARQFAEYLNQNGNAARLGMRRLDLNNPYLAPAGAIVVVRAGTPGTAHPTAGDIAVAGGNGEFYNGGMMGYGGSGNFFAGNTYVLGIYVPAIN